MSNMGRNPKREIMPVRVNGGLVSDVCTPACVSTLTLFLAEQMVVEFGKREGWKDVGGVLSTYLVSSHRIKVADGQDMDYVSYSAE